MRATFHLSVATESGGPSGLVVEDLLDLLHQLGSQLLEQLQGTKVVLQLLNLGGTKYDSGDIGILCSPCQTKLGDSATELLGDGGELSDLVNL